MKTQCGRAARVGSDRSCRLFCSGLRSLSKLQLDYMTIAPGSSGSCSKPTSKQTNDTDDDDKDYKDNNEPGDLCKGFVWASGGGGLSFGC